MIVFGFALGPFGIKYVDPATLQTLAPVFTTFTLLFLLFDGAFNIDLTSLVKEFSHSFFLTSFSFFVSSILIMVVMLFVGFPWMLALLVRCILGGVSSAFVIPVLGQMNIPKKLYSLLALESALTDVFCIVFSLTIMEIMEFGNIAAKAVATQLVSLFAIAGLIGVLAGVLWIVLSIKVFKEHNYIMVIAYLIFLYVLTEFLGGNGAIATLFFGLMLKNSKQLTAILEGIVSRTSKKKKGRKAKAKGGVNVTTHSEQYFYHQISFFLKVLFFVYIGLLLDFSDIKAIIVGAILSVIILFSRMSSFVVVGKYPADQKKLINAIFARGLAAAAIAQLALEAGVPQAEFIVKVVFMVITGTILLSSIRVFMIKKLFPQAS